jgi:hypothetical protein
VSVTFALSVTGITVRAAAIAALAIVALLLTGWRKPARAEPRSPRGSSRMVPLAIAPEPDHGAHGIVVDHLDAPLYRRPSAIRRFVSGLLSGAVGILVGVLLAIVIAFGIALAVIWMTDLLG